MVRLMIYCEGETEETFVNNILIPQLSGLGVYASAHPCRGVSKYNRIKKDITALCRDFKDGYVTTMLDYYGLPSDTPGIDRKDRDIYSMIDGIENDIGSDIGKKNFIPNLMLHEFEALLFSCPECFEYCGLDDRAINYLKNIVEDFDTPEHINNNPNTAPSKRILALYGGYSKPIDGYNIAKNIGLNRMRSECRHFDAWIRKLESLGTE